DQWVHDEVHALTALVPLERDLKVVLVLAREVRPLRRLGHAVLAVTRRGLRAPGLDLRLRRARARRLGLALEAREVRRDVGDVLIRQRRRLRMHRLVAARAAPIPL